MDHRDETMRAPADYPVVIFDFDGTVADTAPAILRVATEVLACHGFHLSREDMLPMIGPPLEEGFRMICGVGTKQGEEFAAEYRALFDELVTPEDYPLMPRMWELLEGLRARGRRLAIATSRMEVGARTMVDLLGLTQFEAVAGRIDGVRYTKAESIAAALESLEVDASDAIMVGDRLHDVHGAAELGIPCIGVYTGAAVPREHEDAGAAFVAHGTSELPAIFGL